MTDSGAGRGKKILKIMGIFRRLLKYCKIDGKKIRTGVDVTR